MTPRRYTFIIADRRSGKVLRSTINIRPALITLVVLAALPILIGQGIALKASLDAASIVAKSQTFERENARFRSLSQTLSGKIEALQTVITDVGARAQLDPAVSSSIERLPSLTRTRAMGMGTTQTTALGGQKELAALSTPEETFVWLHMLLDGLESQISIVSTAVAQRNELAQATPTLWPTRGWLSSTMGRRKDPFTGAPVFHRGIDIAGMRGRPVYATASGEVVAVGTQGNYGKRVIIDHGFDIETRYGHLLGYTVEEGDWVERGDQVGRMGDTGRTTGYHLHYEVLANGRLLNPLRLLTQQTPLEK